MKRINKKCRDAVIAALLHFVTYTLKYYAKNLS